MKGRVCALLLAANLCLLAVLGLYRQLEAAPPKNAEPFANAVEQRAEMISQLKEVNAQLKEQNSLFRAALKALTEDPK